MTFPIQVCKRLTPSSSVARQCSRTVSNPKAIIDERDCDLNDCMIMCLQKMVERWVKQECSNQFCQSESLILKLLVYDIPSSDILLCFDFSVSVFDFKNSSPVDWENLTPIVPWRFLVQLKLELSNLTLSLLCWNEAILPSIFAKSFQCVYAEALSIITSV